MAIHTGWDGRIISAGNLPKRYQNCMCSCHRMPGVKHIAACCWPDKDRRFEATEVKDVKPE